VQRVHDVLKDREKDLVMLSISIDGTGETAVKPYMTEHGFTFPTLLDQRMEAARQFGVRGTPTTVIVNRNGEIVARAIGPFDLESQPFTTYLDGLLAQRRG
jgi:cytochrome c biogenesis protein CcmG, thiol:disulfide interchange protein DsbE